MNVFYWIGFALGVALAWSALGAVPVLLLVPRARRWWLRPLLRRVTGRAAFHRDWTAAQIAARMNRKYN